jgi:hypothetical protein
MLLDARLKSSISRLFGGHIETTFFAFARTQSPRRRKASGY